VPDRNEIENGKLKMEKGVCHGQRVLPISNFQFSIFNSPPKEAANA
jgi:hypothetical protein